MDKHQAALQLQKVDKSFRTRRNLADCEVLVEETCIGEQESAHSHWSTARRRAAKIGKGLSKNDKAQKLALPCWLEAIDTRHRYERNLNFYYFRWLESDSKEPFFYWLDVGEGKEVSLEKCPRSKLQQQCVKYLGPKERKAYEVVIEDGKLLYKESGELLHTTEDAKWIFVLSTSKTLYVGKKKKCSFHHSSFVAGGVTTSAGRLIVENGILKAVWPYSGYYRHTEENSKDFLAFLEEKNVNLTDVKMVQSLINTVEAEQVLDAREGSYAREISGWTLLIINLLLEIASATLDQLGYALIGMVLAFIALLLATIELIHMAQKERIKRVGRSLLPISHWQSTYNLATGKPAGTIVEYFGLAGAVWQCFYSTMQYTYGRQKKDNPIKMCLLPFIFLLCVVISKLIKTV